MITEFSPSHRGTTIAAKNNSPLRRAGVSRYFVLRMAGAAMPSTLPHEEIVARQTQKMTYSFTAPDGARTKNEFPASASLITDS